MNFQDRSRDSVQSLLAQLRAAQDGGASAGPGTGQPAVPSITTTTGRSSTHTQSGPSTKQLNDLLSSLGHAQTGATPSSTSARRSLIEPFGPVAQAQAQTRSPSAATPKPSDHDTTHQALAPAPAPAQAQIDHRELSFTKALPIVSELLADDGFRREIKRMKVDQDTLERRLWAKGEKVKGEHEKTTRTDKEIARITGKPISPTKEREWRAQLSDQMQDFYRHHCLVSIDGLASRHRDRLEQLGVPGLGGDMADPKVRDRVRRIMDVLEASLDE